MRRQTERWRYRRGRCSWTCRSGRRCGSRCREFPAPSACRTTCAASAECAPPSASRSPSCKRTQDVSHVHNQSKRGCFFVGLQHPRWCVTRANTNPACNLSLESPESDIETVSKEEQLQNEHSMPWPVEKAKGVLFALPANSQNQCDNHNHGESKCCSAHSRGTLKQENELFGNKLATHHSSYSCGLLRTVETMRHPWLGELDQVPLTTMVIWDRTLVIRSGLSTTKVRFPTRSSGIFSWQNLKSGCDSKQPLVKSFWFYVWVQMRSILENRCLSFLRPGLSRGSKVNFKLTVQSKVLGERLSSEQFKAFLHEISENGQKHEVTAMLNIDMERLAFSIIVNKFYKASGHSSMQRWLKTMNMTMQREENRNCGQFKMLQNSPHSPGVLVQISWRKALIGAVKHGEQLLFLKEKAPTN